MSSLAQNEYTPDVVSLPGETLQEVLDDRQMTQAELADRIGRPKKTVNEIVKGKAAITTETALQLERALGISATFWNDLERHYQEYIARTQERERLVSYIPWLKELPVKKMIEEGWIEQHEEKSDQVRELLDFFGVVSPGQWRLVFEEPQASFRRSTAFKADPGALAAWLRKGELEAQDLDCAEFDKKRFREALVEARSLTKQPIEEATRRLQEICAEAGVAVVFVPEMPRSRVSGATRWLSPTKAIIQLSIRYRTDDHLWFSFFHEAGHILKHGKKATFLDQGKSDSTGQEEEEANQFAADFLIPPKALEELRPAAAARRISRAQVLAFADEQGIAPGIVVGRLQHMGWLTYKQLNGLKRKLVWAEAD